MKIGTKIGFFSNQKYIDKISEYVDFFELYALPSFGYKKLKVSKPVVIHAAHQGHGVNIADIDCEKGNIEAINFAKDAADFYKSDLIIFHPGSINSKNCSYKNAINFVKDNYDTRLAVENLPKTISEQSYLCTKPEEVIEFVKDSSVRFCFDFCHSLEASTFNNEESYVNEFLALDPAHFHINDTRLSNLTNNPNAGGHLNLGEGDIELEQHIKSIKKNSALTLETPIDIEKHKEEIELIRRLVA